MKLQQRPLLRKSYHRTHIVEIFEQTRFHTTLVDMLISKFRSLPQRCAQNNLTATYLILYRIVSVPPSVHEKTECGIPSALGCACCSWPSGTGPGNRSVFIIELGIRFMLRTRQTSSFYPRTPRSWELLHFTCDLGRLGVGIRYAVACS